MVSLASESVTSLYVGVGKVSGSRKSGFCWDGTLALPGTGVPALDASARDAFAAGCARDDGSQPGQRGY